MGANMILAAWTIKHKSSWKATERYALKLLQKAERNIRKAKKFDKDFLENWFSRDQEGIDNARDTLLLDVDELRAAVMGHHRQVAWICAGRYDVLVTGGLSHGDSPTELYDSIDRLQAAGMLPDADSEAMTGNGPWLNDAIQFPRLISELQAAGAFTEEVVAELKDNMDLDETRIFSLVRRADREWERLKRETCPPRAK